MYVRIWIAKSAAEPDYDDSTFRVTIDDAAGSRVRLEDIYLSSSKTTIGIQDAVGNPSQVDSGSKQRTVTVTCVSDRREERDDKVKMLQWLSLIPNTSSDFPEGYLGFETDYEEMDGFNVVPHATAGYKLTSLTSDRLDGPPEKVAYTLGLEFSRDVGRLKLRADLFGGQ